MKKFIPVILIGLLMISGCAGADKSAGMQYSVLSGGKDFSKPIKGAKIFNSSDEYAAFLMARAMKKNDPVEKFDFEKSSLLVVYLGKEASDGFGLEIKDLSNADDKLTVTAAMVKGAEPIYYISIPKTDKQAELVTE